MRFDKFTKLLEKTPIGQQNINRILCDENVKEYIKRYITNIVYDIRSTTYIDHLLKISTSVIGSSLLDECLNDISYESNNNIKCRDINFIIKTFQDFDKKKFKRFYELIYDFNYTDKCLNKKYQYMKIEFLINIGIISLSDTIRINNVKKSILEYLDSIRCVNDNLVDLIIEYYKTNFDGKIWHFNNMFNKITTQKALEQKNNHMAILEKSFDIPKCLLSIIYGYI